MTAPRHCWRALPATALLNAGAPWAQIPGDAQALYNISLEALIAAVQQAAAPPPAALRYLALRQKLNDFNRLRLALDGQQGRAAQQELWAQAHGYLSGNQYRRSQVLGQSLNATSEIDRLADDPVLHSFIGANQARDDLSGMDSDADLQRGYTVGLQQKVYSCQAITAQDLYIFAQGLPPKTDFDFFVTQIPRAPFGLSWYQADVETDEHGNAFQHVRGIFSIETFTVAPNGAPAPVVFDGPFPDASVSPATNPVQMYHLGLWFDSFTDAQNAGCPATVTPFNGEHQAGIQVLNTSNFADEEGPLRQLK